MKIETVSNIGLFLIAVGIMAAIIGTYIIYSSLSDYSQCALAPASVCQVSDQVYIQFLTRQNYGNSAAFYGFMSIIIGAILYTSAWVRKAGAVPKETSSNAPKT